MPQIPEYCLRGKSQAYTKANANKVNEAWIENNPDHLTCPLSFLRNFG